MVQENNTGQEPLFEAIASLLRRAGVVGSAVLCACVSVPISGLVSFCADKVWASHRTDLDSMTVPELALVAMLIGPLLETLFFQLMVGTAAKAFVSSIGARLPIMCIPFALSHFALGISAGLSVGVVGGIAFGFLFLAGQDASVSKGVLATMLAHSLHNASVLVADRLG